MVTRGKPAPEVVLDANRRKLTIHYVTVGQAFGTRAELRRGSRVVAETQVVSLGATAAARGHALAIARTVR